MCSYGQPYIRRNDPRVGQHKSRRAVARITGQSVIEMLNTVAKLHLETALSMGASQGDVDLALALVRLINNSSENTSSEFRLVARTEFLTAYCTMDPNDL